MRRIAASSSINAVSFSSARTTTVFRIRDVRPQSRSFVIRVYDDAGNVIETHGHKGEFNDS